MGYGFQNWDRKISDNNVMWERGTGLQSYNSFKERQWHR